MPRDSATQTCPRCHHVRDASIEQCPRCGWGPVGEAVGKVGEMIAGLRAAGLDAWDAIDDPEAFIREMRGGEEDDA